MGVASWWNTLASYTKRALSSVANWSNTYYDLATVLLPQESVTWRRALAHPAVWRAVSLVSADVAKVPIHLYRRGRGGERIEADDEPAARLLRERPRRGVSAYVFRRTLTMHALLFGDGYAMIERDSAGTPIRLTILDPEATQPEWRRSQLVWRTTLGSRELSLRDDDVLHISNLSLTGVQGLRPLDVLRDALLLELGVQEYALGFFRRGYAMSGVVKSPRPLTSEEIGQLREQLRQRHSGAARAHDIAILAGGLEFQPLAPDAERAQLSESRSAGLRAIAAIFGVPPHKLGDPSRTSYASIEAENEAYLQETLDPWLVCWEAEATLKLTPNPSEYYFEHNRNALVRAAFDTRMSGYARLVSIGVLSPNEVRERENLNKRSGGDIYYVPANWIPVSSGAAQGTTE